MGGRGWRTRKEGASINNNNMFGLQQQQKRTFAQKNKELEAIKETAINLRRNRGMKTDEIPWDAPEKSVGEVLLGGGKSRKMFDWEFPYYLLMGGGFLLAIVGEWNRSDRRVLSWARDEAEERRRRRAEGLDVEIGHNYAPGGFIVNKEPKTWIKTVGGLRPVVVGGDEEEE